MINKYISIRNLVISILIILLISIFLNKFSIEPFYYMSQTKSALDQRFENENRSNLNSFLIKIKQEREKKTKENYEKLKEDINHEYRIINEYLQIIKNKPTCDKLRSLCSYSNFSSDKGTEDRELFCQQRLKNCNYNIGTQNCEYDLSLGIDQKDCLNTLYRSSSRPTHSVSSTQPTNSISSQ